MVCHNGVAVEEFRGLSSAGRAVALQASGRRFDPGRLHHSTGLLWEDNQVSEIMSPMSGSSASNQSENREKGICLGPREREPFGHRLQPRPVLGSSQNDLVFSSMLSINRKVESTLNVSSAEG